MRTHPIVEYYQALRDSAPCLSRAATLPKGTKPAVAGVNKGNGVKQCLGENFDGRVEPCPTVFEIERAIAQRRRASRTVHANLVNIEFRRGFYEVYAKGEDLSPTAYTAVHAEDKRKAFVGIHKVQNNFEVVSRRETPPPLPQQRLVIEINNRGLFLSFCCLPEAQPLHISLCTGVRVTNLRYPKKDL